MAIYKGENPYIYGFHDPGGENLMIVNGEAKGWTLVTEAIGAEDHERGGGDYRHISDKGIGLIVRLNQSYGPNGTIPREARYPGFAQRVANFVEDSKGAHIWLIGNEMNFEREQPRQEGSDQAEVITPRRYAKCYKMCRQKVKALPGHQDDLVVVGAPAPWNAQTKYPADPDGKYEANPTGDWVQYLQDILLSIGPEECDAIAIHTYSHGYAADMVFNEAKMKPPFDNRHYNFYAYKDQMEAIPKNMRHLPVYITEANGDREGGHDGPTWPFGNNGWIKNAYKEINNWNQSGKQQIRCLILFRWQKDPLGWSIDGEPEVQQDFKEAVAQNYKWNPAVGVPAKAEPKPEPEAQPKPTPTVTPTSTATSTPTSKPQAIPKPPTPSYRVRYLKHTTPVTVTAKETLNVTFTIQNTGSLTWIRGGNNPFRLGFKWHDAAGQALTLPPDLDFRTPLPQDVPPNGQVTLQARLRTPDAPGTYQLRWDMVHELVTWFVTQGDAGLLVSPIQVNPAVEVAPPPAPVAKPAPTPKPKPTPTPTPASVPLPSEPVHVQIQNVINRLARHPSKRYAKRDLSAIKRIIVHHTATPASITVQRIAEYQVETKGLPGITYHFCLTDRGLAYQGQPLTSMAAHAGQNSRDSVGVCLIGNFMAASPPQAQLESAASVLAQLASKLNLTTANIFGYRELAKTQSPGATWPGWKQPLLARVRTLMAAPAVAPAGKPIQHYMLLWHRGQGNWAEWDLRGALDYISKFPVTIGFSVEEAKLAANVTIVGGPGGIPAEVDQVLRAAGCQVERLAGKTDADTRQMLKQLAAENKRFMTL